MAAMMHRDELQREESRIRSYVAGQIRSLIRWGWRGDFRELRAELAQEAWLGLLLALRNGNGNGKDADVNKGIRRQLNRWWHRERDWQQNVILWTEPGEDGSEDREAP